MNRVSHTGLGQSCSTTGSTQNHRLQRNPLRRFPFIPLCQGQLGLAQLSPCPRCREAAGPGRCVPAPPATQAQPGQTRTARGAPRPWVQLGIKALRQGQHRGTAKIQGALKGCRGPPHLASLYASGATNARRDRRSYRRGSGKSPFWGQPLSQGDSQTQEPAGFVLLTQISLGLQRVRRAPPPPLRLQARTALAAAPHLSRRYSSASWRLPGSPAAPRRHRHRHQQ